MRSVSPAAAAARILLETPTLELAIPNAGGAHIAFDPTGQLIASTDCGETVGIWRADDGQLVRSHTQSQGASNISFSPDGRWIASADGVVVDVWSAADGTAVASLRGHTVDIKALAFSPDGRMLASGGWDRSVKLWDCKSWKNVRTLGWPLNPTLYQLTGIFRPGELVPAQYIRCVAFSPNGTLLASGWENDIQLWDVRSGLIVRRFRGHSALVVSVAFTPDGERLASGSDDHTVIVWDVGSAKPLQRFRAGPAQLWCVTFSPDGRLLAAGDGSGVGGVAEEKWPSVRLWDHVRGELLYRFPANLQTSYAYAVAFSPDGRTLAIGDPRQGVGVELWRVRYGVDKKGEEGAAEPPEASQLPP